ncbi:ATP-dependent DNA helicase RecG, partial [Xanthovirga aplysinae]|uniref:ATP-dependent DNA helicase RecG n=1 Tax=Xanthovirga aplysinae TaxID=2529853 RepID=UPI0012BD728D
MAGFFDTHIEYLKGVGPQKAALINKELGIFTFRELIQHYPFRYEDRTRFYQISEINPDLPYVQIKGKIRSIETSGEGRKKRLVARFTDNSGETELVWFKGIQWVIKKLKTGVNYIIVGKATAFNGVINIVHPEIEVLTEQNAAGGYFQPVYHTTEKLKSRYLDSKGISKIQKELVKRALPNLRETLPPSIGEKYSLMPKQKAIINIHFPSNTETLQKAKFRLKFEELFYIQLRLLKLKLSRSEKFKGQFLNKTELLTTFYQEHLPFELTNAQKNVIKEIYYDLRSGKQMNRLLQGDVGSGKTMVAFICMLLAVDSKAQAALMAPTEILADQHYEGLKEYANQLGIKIGKLTGSTRTKERKILHTQLESGELDILVGTHALLEDKVQFKNLGLCIIDEQHRFGVAQRAKLWSKNAYVYPHVLVMTATPIPRTLAMTLYGDLDVSVIDELPAGRKPIKTIHRYDANRLQVFGFIREQIQKGRQVYIVYPLIEGSEKLDYKDLMDGYESVQRAFSEYQISIVHGKMKAQDKDFEMQRFVKGETQIMVATTVIEVGVNVPNASVMVIENTERFGLAQLHQLRGRVGRGAEQSYCILMSGYKLSKEGKTRIETMVRTNNGFEIADTDLQLRGPGDLNGTLQSGVPELSIADLSQDGKILQIARESAREILEKDPNLEEP